MRWTGFGGSRQARTVAHVAEFPVEMYVSRTEAGAVERVAEAITVPTSADPPGTTRERHG